MTLSIVFDPKMPDDGFAGEQLSEEILADTNERIPVRSRPARRSITLERVADAVSPSDLGQGYTLEVAPQRITISAQTSDGIFYGVQTLKQLVRANCTVGAIPACKIVDWPALKYRGWQHDISRGPIPTDAFLRKEIRSLSEFKLNMFTLYTEHVFKLKKYPYIAPDDGITADEVSALCAYGKQFHVEVVGNFQSFGHFANILKHPELSDMAETPGVLSPSKPKSYKFLADVYSEIAPAYASPLFTINCDEVGGLERGPSKDLVKKIGVAGVYAQHINRIADLLRPYGKTPMMWGDIALNFPAIVPKLPKDLIVLPWAYDARANFDGEILPFTKFGLRFMVSPGVSCWSQIWPDLDNATVKISNFIRDGAKNGALGVLNTSWDDSGLNLFNDNWFEFIWGAECSWKPAIPEAGQDADEVRNRRFEAYSEEFPAVFYGVDDPAITKAMLALSELRKNPISGGMRDGAMWRDPVAAYAKLQNPQEIPAYVSDVSTISQTLAQAQTKATYNAATLDFALFSAREAMYLGESLDAAHRMSDPRLRSDDASCPTRSLTSSGSTPSCGSERTGLGGLTRISPTTTISPFEDGEASQPNEVTLGDTIQHARKGQTRKASMKKQVFAFCAGAFATGLLLAGCGSGDAPKTATGNGKDLDVVSFQGGYGIDFFQQAGKEYEAKHPGTQHQGDRRPTGLGAASPPLCEQYATLVDLAWLGHGLLATHLRWPSPPVG